MPTAHRIDAAHRARLVPLALFSIAALAAAARGAAQTIAITGGKVYPVSSAPIEHGTVVIKDGKIVAVGAHVTIPSDAQRVDATGKVVTPGFVNAYTTLGLVEVGFSGPPREVSATGKNNIAASFTAWDGFDPRSALIPQAREGGITSALVIPQGGLVAGQAAVFDLTQVEPSTSVAEMMIRTPAAMVAQIEDDRSAGVGAKGELLVKLRELLEDTRAYMRRRADFERAQTRPFAASRLDLDAMVPVVEGRVPLLVAADEARDIQAAIALAQDFHLKLIVGGAAEGWMVAPALAKAKVPVLAGAMYNIPQYGALGARQENVALMRKAGVEVALIGNAGGGDEELFNVRNLRFEAGNAVAYGLDWDDALRAVTLAPATIFGVAGRVGSLRPGLEANVVIWSGDPLDFPAHPDAVYVRGVHVEQPSREDLLTKRYEQVPPKFSAP